MLKLVIALPIISSIPSLDSSSNVSLNELVVLSSLPRIHIQLLQIGSTKPRLVPSLLVFILNVRLRCNSVEECLPTIS